MTRTYTREDIEREFKIENNKIVSPGMYEGSPRFTPYFDAKSEDRGKSMHTVRDEDRTQFPELKPYKTVVLSKGDDGRISAQAFVSADYW